MSPVTLKWSGDALYLGYLRVAYLLPGRTSVKWFSDADGHASEPYQSKDDARQDCLAHVRDLLAKAGAP